VAVDTSRRLVGGSMSRARKGVCDDIPIRRWVPWSCFARSL